MPRLVTVRLIVALFAFVAVSMDSATKVIHGVLHHRETTAHAQVTASASNDQAFATAVEEADLDEMHDALHHAAVAPLSLAVPCALGVHVVPVPRALVASSRAPLDFVVEEFPPGARMGPTQSRAPPTA